MNRDIFDESFLPEEKRWENLTLANDFLFGKIMSDKSLCTEAHHSCRADRDRRISAKITIDQHGKEYRI